MSSQSRPLKEWMSFGEASEKLGVNRHAVKRLADSGNLTVRCVPGTHPRVWGPDVDRLVERSTRHARPA
jgi:hypothetical protein